MDLNEKIYIERKRTKFSKIRHTFRYKMLGRAKISSAEILQNMSNIFDEYVFSYHVEGLDIYDYVGNVLNKKFETDHIDIPIKTFVTLKDTNRLEFSAKIRIYFKRSNLYRFTGKVYKYHLKFEVVELELVKFNLNYKELDRILVNKLTGNIDVIDFLSFKDFWKHELKEKHGEVNTYVRNRLSQKLILFQEQNKLE